MPNPVNAAHRLSLIAACGLVSLSACGLGLDNTERLERARSAFDRSEYRTAIIDTRNVLQNEPGNREARLLLGRASLAVTDPATAEKELRRALELGTELKEVAVDLGKAMLGLGQFERLLEEIQPELAGNESDRRAILRLHGEALLRMGSPVASRAAFEEALAADANDVDAKLGVARSYLAEREFEKARASVDEALVTDPGHAPAWLASGSLHMTTNNAAAASTDFAKGLDAARKRSDSSSETSALVGLIESRLAQQDLEGAREALASLQGVAPKHPSTRFLTARIAYLDEDFELAESELQEILRVAPNAAPAQFLMGAVHLKRGNLGQAEMHLSSVVAAAPDHVDARKLLAETRLKQNRADEAADILRDVAGAAGADLATLSLAVRASLDAGEYNDAAVYLEKALANDPDNGDMKLDLAAAYLAAGEVEKAEALLSSLSSSGDGSSQNAYRHDLLNVMAALRRGDTSAAMRDALAMAERWPDDVRAHNLIGGIAMSTEQFALARKHFLAAQKIYPADTTSYVNIAAIALQQNDLDAARAQYLAAVEQQPTSIALMLALARLEARAEKAQAAMEWLEKARATDATAMEPRVLLARYYLEQRAFAPAATVAGEAAGLDRDNAVAHNLLGLARQGLGEAEAALESFKRATMADPEQKLYRLNEARAHAALGHDEAAERVLLGYGGLDLADLETAVLLAGLKIRQGDGKGAMQLARDLQEQHSGNGLPWALEAELLAADQKFAEAAQAYDKALSLRPDDSRLVWRAFQVRSSGNLHNPVQPLLSYLERRPLDTDTRLVLAQAYQSEGDGVAAVREYERILETAPDNFVALNNLGWAYFESGDERAESIARRAFEVSPENGAVADTLGWIQVSNGNLVEGIPTLRKAAELSGGRAEIRFHLASALAAAGEKDEARQLLEEVLAGDSRFSSRGDAERLLATL